MAHLKIKHIKKDGPNHINNWPAIPTEIGPNEITGILSGWYCVRVAPNGIEYLQPTATRFDDFDTCKKAANIHNQWLGMTTTQVAILYSQRRFDHSQPSTND